MFDLMLTGNYNPMQIREIATNEWGYRTPKGNKLGRSTMYNMLSNTFYYGVFEYPVKSGNWYKGIHEGIVTEEEYDKVQYLLGKAGRPRPKNHIFAFIGMMKCGECGASITAETKIKKQKNGNVHNYIYYHCTKRVDPNCSQGSLEEKELTRQVSEEIESIEMPEEFHSFAMKWWKKENEEEATKRNAIVSSQQRAYKACLAKMDGLMEMRAGGEITPQEYTEKKAELFEQRKGLEKEFGDTGKRIDQWEKTGDEMLTFIETAVDKFKNGSLMTRKGILSTLGSDLIVKDKILRIDIDKTLFPLKRIKKMYTQ
jgi:predicted metal-binding protein